jgi:hypothetical protein
MPWTQSTSIIHELVKALATLHACGVVHRDIKPGNVIIEQKPDGDVLEAARPRDRQGPAGPRDQQQRAADPPGIRARDAALHGPGAVRRGLQGRARRPLRRGDHAVRVPDRGRAVEVVRTAGRGAPVHADPAVAGQPKRGDPGDPRRRHAQGDRLQSGRRATRAPTSWRSRWRRSCSRRSVKPRGRGRWPRPRRTGPSRGRGLRAAFAIGDLDARGWVALRWWVTLTSVCAAMCFVVAIAAAMRRPRMNEVPLLDEALLQALHPRPAKAPDEAVGSGEALLVTAGSRRPATAPLSETSPHAQSAETTSNARSEGRAEVAGRPTRRPGRSRTETSDAETERPNSPEPTHASPKVRAEVAELGRAAEGPAEWSQEDDDAPPPILAGTVQGVLAGAKRTLQARCPGVKGSTTIEIDRRRRHGQAAAHSTCRPARRRRSAIASCTTRRRRSSSRGWRSASPGIRSSSICDRVLNARNSGAVLVADSGGRRCGDASRVEIRVAAAM